MILKKKLLYVSFILVALSFSISPTFANPPDSGPVRQSENTKLKNGINVILDLDPSSLLTAIQIWISVGSVDEDETNSGISHFIEHTIFKGTKTKTQKEIAPEIEKYGGIINAATSKDYTFFYTLITSSNSLKALEILSDVVLNPEFPEQEVEKERQVVIEEIKRKDDNPQSQLFEEFYSQVYRESPYASRVIGNEDIILGLKRVDLLAFHNKFYTSNNIFVVVTGNFDRDKVLELVEKYFGGLQKGKKPKNKLLMYRPKYKKEHAKKIIKRDVAQGYVIMGFPAASINSDEQYSLDLASYILGAGRACRLNKRLVEQSKLALSVSCSFSSKKGPGLFNVYGVCDPEKAPELSNRILLELLDLSINPVSEEELNRAKTLLLRDKLYERQTPDGRAGELGFYMVLGNGAISEDYVSKVKEVKAKDIKKVISKYLVFPNMPTVIMTP